MTEAATRTCYLHPDTPAGVVCQRCDRPICPRCMHQASVGFQCPECVKKGGTKVVRGPAALGAAFQPVVTFALIALNVAIWVGGAVMGTSGSVLGGANVLDVRGGLLSSAYLVHSVSSSSVVGVAHGEWWRVVTAGFLHYGVIHLGMNMWALYILGSITERVFGRARFLAVYLVALLGGSLGALVLTPDALTVGASGAIFGLMGGLLVVAKSRGIRLADTGLLTVLGINLLITFGIPGISIGGHLGGLAGGALAAAIVVTLPQQLFGRVPGRSAVREVAPLVACAAVALVLVFASTAVAGRHPRPTVVCVVEPSGVQGVLDGVGCGTIR